MVKNNFLLLLVIAPILLSNETKERTYPGKQPTGNWNGTITWIKTSESSGKRTWTVEGHECSYRWAFSFTFKVTANFKNGSGSVIRSDYTSKWEKDSIIFVAKDKVYMIEERTTVIECNNTGDMDLEVEFNEDNNHQQFYYVSFFTPACQEKIRVEVKNNIHGNSSNHSVNEHQGTQITLPPEFPGKPVEKDPTVLSGTYEETIPTQDGGKITTSATWNLSKGQSKPELLVTPVGENVDYANWMPEPGTSEATPGNQLNIELHLQETGGGSPPVKAKFFELQLVNTSKQPGICLNAPVVPSTPKHDLRFLPQDGAIVSPDGQSVKILCEDGENGEVSIGSYDGGGWTILKAKAILENNKTVEGVLSEDKSKKEIPVPKNKTGGKIAQRWLEDNNNPGETNDLERSQGNSNDGDGLSAYEEYRGVMSEGKFIRLDPNTKELGVTLKKSDLSTFSEGMKKLENVTGFRIVKFYDNEIPTNRRVNQNGLHANIFKQFALYLVTGTLPGNQSGKAIGSPGIPSQVSPVTISLVNIQQSYLEDQAKARRMNTVLPYTEKELIATVVAHELAHGVNASHHGSGPDPAIILNQPIQANSVPPGRIFLHNGTEHRGRPYTVIGQAGIPGNQQSGDLGCIMAINSLCDWAVQETTTINYFYEVPIIPLGSGLCISRSGTGINAGGKYFGDASKGNCIVQLKLK